MTSPVLLHGPDRAPALRSHHGEGARKIFFCFMPRNPLKSLDSGERIRRNPRKFKSHERDRGPSRRNGDGPRKLKNGSRPAAKGANPTPSKPKAQLRPPARVEGVSQLAISLRYRSSGGLPPRSWKSSDRDDKPRSWLANQYDVEVPEGGRPRVLRRSIVFFDDVLKAGVGSFDRYFRYPVT